MTLLLAILVGLLFTVGIYLLMQRTPAQLIIGLMVLGNGANLSCLSERRIDPRSSAAHCARGRCPPREPPTPCPRPWS